MFLGFQTQLTNANIVNLRFSEQYPFQSLVCLHRNKKSYFFFLFFHHLTVGACQNTQFDSIVVSKRGHM